MKKQLCSLLPHSKLPSDYYAVFKNITKYSTWDLKSLLKLNGLEDTRNGIRTLNNKAQVLSLAQFKSHKSEFIVPNKNPYGIPQGSPISAVLSNIYMLEFDKKIRQHIDSLGGLYMRYSDDFIVILPKKTVSDFPARLSWIQRTIKSIPNLHLQPKKTQLFFYQHEKIMNCNVKFIKDAEPGKNFLNYLGFTFDGKVITIRDKTLSKYYYRMYRKIKTIVKNNGLTRKKNKISCKNLYSKYSEKGAHQGSGNFLTYVQRAEAVFGKSEAINRGTRQHMQKIRKRLDKIKK